MSSSGEYALLIAVFPLVVFLQPPWTILWSNFLPGWDFLSRWTLREMKRLQERFLLEMICHFGSSAFCPKEFPLFFVGCGFTAISIVLHPRQQHILVASRTLRCRGWAVAPRKNRNIFGTQKSFAGVARKHNNTSLLFSFRPHSPVDITIPYRTWVYIVAALPSEIF